MSKIYDALLRAELDRASSATSNRSESDSPEATLTRDILASLQQDRWPMQAARPVQVVEEVEDWRATADPEGVFPEPIAVWNPSHSQHIDLAEDAGTVEPVAFVALKTCPNCSLPYGARTERKGFFQKKIASFFGYFPWTCKACRVNFYSKDRGASAPEGAKG